jgi:hypothetical protein
VLGCGWNSRRHIRLLDCMCPNLQCTDRNAAFPRELEGPGLEGESAPPLVTLNRLLVRLCQHQPTWYVHIPYVH